MSTRKRDPLANLDDKRCARRFRRKTMRVMVDYVSDGRACCEYATTLGAGGMFIQSESPLPKGSLLKVRFRLSEDPSDLIEMEARVVWSQPPSADDVRRDPGMGVQFTDKPAIADLAHRLDRLDRLGDE
ncbi:MAG: PilZ domain-containing protein [Deltaproteobacteria bacterium]|nr:PilZ domain-containing protein [Deltaproteobacteria bacterium]